MYTGDSMEETWDDVICCVPRWLEKGGHWTGVFVRFPRTGGTEAVSRQAKAKGAYNTLGAHARHRECEFIACGRGCADSLYVDCYPAAAGVGPFHVGFD